MLKYIGKIIVLIIFSFSLLGCRNTVQNGELLSTLEKDNVNFKVKITSFREKRDFAQILAGANYVFEVKVKDEQNWREIMTVQFDDPIPIDDNSIYFVHEKIGFIFMRTKYAFTTDAGITWQVWEISQNQSLKNDATCKIRNIKLDVSGKGTMEIQCNKILKTLFTLDYGTNWNDEK